MCIDSYRAADLCYVGSLHDGMNLVAKEFVCARDDERGVLVLSQIRRRGRQLTGAMTVNPYAIDESAQALARALSMTGRGAGEADARMRSVVAEFNTYWWAGQMLQDAARSTGFLRRNRFKTERGIRSAGPRGF